MGKRSKRPKYIKGKVPEGLKQDNVNHDMKFRNGRSKRPDTGKKYNRGKHNTPNQK